LSTAPSSACSTVLWAFPTTSTSKKSRMPIETALSAARSLGAGLRRRPKGKPRKIVKPAMAPSSQSRPVDISNAASIGRS